jgi:DNA uptake protein ComE-like DNA-binding protein
MAWVMATGLAGIAVPPAAAQSPAAQAAAATGQPATVSKKANPAVPVKLVDINSASPAQLKTLPGIGEAEARKIVDGRPYLSKADLVTSKILPAGIYLSLKNRIIAKPVAKRPPAGSRQP